MTDSKNGSLPIIMRKDDFRLLCPLHACEKYRSITSLDNTFDFHRGAGWSLFFRVRKSGHGTLNVIFLLPNTRARNSTAQTCVSLRTPQLFRECLWKQRFRWPTLPGNCARNNLSRVRSSSQNWACRNYCRTLPTRWRQRKVINKKKPHIHFIVALFFFVRHQFLFQLPFLTQ